MTSDSGPAVQPPLGVGVIVGETFSLFFSRITGFVPLAFVPILAVQSASALMTGELFDPIVEDSRSGGSGFAQTLLESFGYAVANALLVQAALDARLGRPLRVRDYMDAAGKRLGWLFLCSTIVTVCASIALLAGIVPGLWLFAVWSAVVPAVVIEQAGVDSLARSAVLTREYRWPIVGVLLIMILATGLPFGIAVYLSLALIPTLGPLLWLAVMALASAVCFGLFYVAGALIYARLREIKEGAGAETLSEVFA